MKTITLGEKFVNRKFDFRETCFGICERNSQILLRKKKNEIAMVGGGIEQGETHESCLKSEFLAESGYSVESISELCTIDCFWLAGGEWAMESLSNFYIVTLSEEAKSPTEDGHEPLWVQIDKAKIFYLYLIIKKA